MKNKLNIIHKWVLFIIAYAIVVIVLYLSLAFAYTYNDEHDRATFQPHSNIYSYIGTEYTIKDNITAKELYNKLMLEIRSDSAAVYGRRETSYMSRQYCDSAENALETMSGKLGHNEGAGKGPRYYAISFLIPYDNRHLNLSGNLFNTGTDRRYVMYAGNVVYGVKIFNTKPITLVVNRSDDIDAQKVNCKLDRYFEQHYLNKVCNYNRRDFRNAYFFVAKWAFYHFYYVLMIGAILTLVVYLIERWIKNKKLQARWEREYYGN